MIFLLSYSSSYYRTRIFKNFKLNLIIGDLISFVGYITAGIENLLTFALTPTKERVCYSETIFEIL